MPYSDWQFWVVTALFLGGLWMIARLFMPPRKNGARCPTCSPGAERTRKRRVSLTIEQRPTTSRRKS